MGVDRDERAIVGRFAIITMPRTGSSLLCSLLRSHRQIACHSELFNGWRPEGVGDIAALRDVDWRRRQPLEWLDHILCETEAQFTRASMIGFKLHMHDRLSVLEYLLLDSRMKILLLSRENRIAQYASWLQTQHTKRYTHKNRGRQSPGLLEFSMPEFVEFVRRQAMVFGLVESVINDPARLLRIEYAELGDPACHRRICEFLGVSITTLEADNVRMGSPHLRERFADPAAVEQALAHTVWRGWLDRPYT